MNIALLQLDLAVGDVEHNARAILDAVHQAADRVGHLDLAVTSELSLLGYPAEDLVARDDVLAACQQWLDWLARQLLEVPVTSVVVGLPAAGEPAAHLDARQRTVRNRVAVLSQGRVTHTYDKVKLPDYGVFDESRHFAPGDEPGRLLLVPDPHPVDRGGVMAVSLLVCEDLWSDDPAGPLATQTANLTAEEPDFHAFTPALVVVPNASPWQLGKPAARLARVREVAARLGRPVVYVNQVGATDDLLFDGRSMVVWPDGQAAIAAAWQPDVLVVDHGGPSTTADDHLWSRPPVQSSDPATVVVDTTDPDALAATRPDAVVLSDPDPCPVPAERLTDAHLADVWAGLSTGLASYMADCGFDQVVLGLSGGIDSAVVAVLAADTLGPEHVLGLRLPSPYSSDHSLADAAQLAARLGIACHTVPIASQMQAADERLGELWDRLGVDPAPDVTEENVQARLRGLVLMAVSNKTGRMLLTTGNKSEAAVGYATLYGDMAGGYAPLVDLPKTLVYALARWRNRTDTDLQGRAWATAPIPTGSVTKPPSAELAPDQHDTDSLPDYPVLDDILVRFVDHDASRDDLLAAGHDPDVVDRVCALVLRAEYKRRQAPPGPKVTTRAFARDRRFPIASRWRPATARPAADAPRTLQARNRRRLADLARRLSRDALDRDAFRTLLQLDDEQLDQMLASGRVVAFDHAGVSWFPRWQLTDAPTVQLRDEVVDLTGGRHVDGLVLTSWMDALNPALGGRTPAQALDSGDLEWVLAVREHLL